MNEQCKDAARVTTRANKLKNNYFNLFIFYFANITYMLRRFSQQPQPLRVIGAAKHFHAPIFLGNSFS